MWLIFGIGVILAAVLNLAGTFTGKGAKLPCTALVHGSFIVYRVSLFLFPEFAGLFGGTAQGLIQLFHQLALFGVEALGDGDRHGDVLVAAARGAEIGDALAAEPEGIAVLGTGGDGEFGLAVQGGNLQLRAQHSLGDGDGYLAQH